VKVARATISDAARIHQLVNFFSQSGEMLPRALSEIYENIRDFLVVRDDKEVIGCAALHITWSDLAEVRSLAVSEDKHKKGIGAALVQACLEEARGLGIETVFCLTYKPGFFEKQGFKQADKGELPRKIWGECYRCPKFPDCDEVALICRLG
jgi:amino-acid N-acetyltransferase